MSLRNSLVRASLSLGLVLGMGAAALAQQTQSTAPQGGTQQSQEGRGPWRRHEGRGGPMGGHMRGGMRMLRELDLTEAQRQQARAIFERFQASTQAQREELSQLRSQRAQGALSADQQARAEQLRKEMHTSMQQMHTELLSILTPEQRARIEQRKREFKERREGMRGPGRGEQNDNQ